MSDKTPAGSARIIKTKRVEHLVTADDDFNTGFHLDAVWDTPFQDLNYTSDQNIEVVPPADVNNYFIDGFSRTVDKITVGIGGVGTPGDVIVLHAHAIRD